MSYRNDLSEHRASVRAITAALLPMQGMCASNEASFFIARARVMLRAADQLLAQALHEPLDCLAGHAPPAAPAALLSEALR